MIERKDGGGKREDDDVGSLTATFFLGFRFISPTCFDEPQSGPLLIHQIVR